MKEFKDFKIEDFKERIKMPKQNLVGKRVIVTPSRLRASRAIPIDIITFEKFQRLNGKIRN